MDADSYLQYSDKTVLITGGGGFLGRHLTARVATAARAVLCIARNYEKSRHDTVKFHLVDLYDARKTCIFFESAKPDIVFHLASASGGSTDVNNVLPHLHDDICTTVNCLIAAQKTGVSRFIVTGSADEPLLLAEYVSASPYSIAKMTCVAFGQMFHKLYGTPTVICRIFMAYGPGQKPRKIVPYIIRSVLANESPKLDWGARPVDWIFVDDTIDALMLAGIKPGVEGKTVEIGSGQLVSVDDVSKKVQNLIRNLPPAVAITGKSHDGVRAADLDAACRYLQWAPKVSLDEGLKATVEWYTSQFFDTSSGSEGLLK
jgi:UDP-glucose 4-epimerase